MTVAESHRPQLSASCDRRDTTFTAVPNPYALHTISKHPLDEKLSYRKFGSHMTVLSLTVMSTASQSSQPHACPRSRLVGSILSRCLFH
ncbi:hypothetical protein M413DRAFT_445046 [Hebeloma cylindrosporum]|uniref:Uncharacterized protein n=1 Tax=Hebeloma cylindrosporum TaxID=76867 RepID=A0A0C2XW00_HEBCY|nr:hypothetical protein M413DRAFT_445046 [Hebeloma cylindrosporum h7]